MKKALVVLLILAVAGGLFAQVTITGEIKSGVGVLITDEKDSSATAPVYEQYIGSKPILGLYSTDTNQGIRFDLNGKYANAEDTVGASFRLRFDTTGNVHYNDGYIGSFAVQHAYGWVKALDGIFTLNGGKIDNAGPFSTAGGVDTSFDQGGGYGLFARVSPMTGLDLGAAAYTRVGYVGYGTPTARTSPLELGDARYNFGVAYTVPDLVTVVGLLRQGNGWMYNQTDAALGVKVHALQPMGINTLILDAAFLNLQQREVDWYYGTTPAPRGGTTADPWNRGKFMTIQIGERVEYVGGPITVGGRFLQQFRMGDDVDYRMDINNKYLFTTKADGTSTIANAGGTLYSYVPDLTFWVWAQYLMETNNGNGAIVPRLDAMYNIGSSKTRASVNYNTGVFSGDWRRWDGITKGQFTEGYSNLQIRPNVQFRFGGTSNTNYVELGYAAFVDLSKFEGSNNNSTRDALGSSMYHNVYVDYKVSF